MALAPNTNVASGRFQRGFGLDAIKPDLPLGSALSLVIHCGILLVALLAWQATPPIMPEDVIAVDMVSDTPSVLGENTSAETAQVGVDTPNPAPLPQTAPPSQDVPTPAPTQLEALPTQSLPTPADPTPPTADLTAPQPEQIQAPVPKTLPPTPPKQATAASAPKPLPKAPLPKPQLPTQPAPRPAPKASAASAPKAAPAVKTGQRKTAQSAPVEFDLAAASSAATGADSGGRRAPQLASRGQAGRLGKAGGGSQLTGDLEAALRAQIQRCWLEPANMADAARLLVVVSLDLGVDGRLMRDPVLVSPTSRAGASPSLVVAIDNALRAVRDCAPFNLPPDRYETWKQVRFNFDPQRMARR